MKPFKDWSLTLKGSVIIVPLTALIFVGNVISAGAKIEPYAPASRGFVREEIAQADPSKAITELRFDLTEKDRRDFQEELLEVEKRLATDPNDSIAARRKKELENDLSELEMKRGRLQCEIHGGSSCWTLTR